MASSSKILPRRRVRSLVSSLLGWYESAKRELPWRRTRDPYAIWVSEVMLQQTRVEAVRGHYERFMERYPAPEDFAERMSELGISNGDRVVIYASAVPWWATRLWWMFRVFGHDDVAVLNGGYGKWTAEGRPTTVDVVEPSAAKFEAAYRQSFL